VFRIIGPRTSWCGVHQLFSRQRVLVQFFSYFITAAKFLGLSGDLERRHREDHGLNTAFLGYWRSIRAAILGAGSQWEAAQAVE